MTITLLQGDCREILPTLPDCSVQCVVTSPPYFGLRSYLPDGHDDKHREMGAEASPAEYVAEMVAVFREVRRVLRDDGTVWLNLGSSYARDEAKGQHKPGDSGKQNYIIERGGGRAAGGFNLKDAFGDKRPNQSLLRGRVPACDSDGIGLFGSQETGSFYSDPCDEHPSGSLSRRHRTLGNDQPPEQSVLQPSPIDHDNGRRDYEEASLGASSPCAPASTTPASSPNAPAESGPEATASACQQSPQPCADGALASARKAQNTHDTASHGETSDDRKSGRGPSSTACNCGSCGICWSYLAIPLLQFKAKDLMDIPSLVSLALQADGWYLRSRIVWHKPNPLPESVTDRPTSAHEHVFLLTKSPRYFYDAEAVREADAGTDHTRNVVEAIDTSNGHLSPHKGIRTAEGRNGTGRNLRNVWTIATQPFSGAHFATFPAELVERCVKAGSRPGDTILDPFAGAFTTALVADRLQRNAIGIELNPDYITMARNRIQQDAGMFAQFAAE